MFETAEVLKWCQDRGWAGVCVLGDVPGVSVVDQWERMSGRDAVLLGWVARWPVVTAQLVGERFGVDAASMSRMLKRWLERGWVVEVAEPVGFGKGRKMYRFGTGGEAVVGALAVRGGTSNGMASHTLATATVAGLCERAGWMVWGEREMIDALGYGWRLDAIEPGRATTTSSQMSLAVELGIGSSSTSQSIDDDDDWWNLTLPMELTGKRVRRHRPDLVMWREEQCVAVEVELSMKSVARVHRILDGYQGSRFDQVVYVMGPGTTVKRLEKLNTTKTSTVHCDRLSVVDYTGLDPTRL